MKTTQNEIFRIQFFFRKTMAFRFFSILMVVLVYWGCFFQRSGMQDGLKAYKGDGELELLVRLSGFAGETYGYALSLPTFRTDITEEYIYRLSGLPLWNGVVYVEMATFIPIFSMPIAEANRLALQIPAEHQVSCKLVEGSTGRVIGKYSGTVQTLEESKTMQFHGASFMKHLFTANLAKILNTESLELHVEYDIRHKPFEGQLQVILTSDALVSK